MKDKNERKHRRTWRHPECVAMMANADFDAVPSLAEAMGLVGPSYDMRLHIDRPCVGESGREFAPGAVVGYRGHVSGGMVRVLLPDQTEDDPEARGGEQTPALVGVGYHGMPMPVTTGTAFWSPSDFKFIAHARQDVPDLVAEVRRLQQVVEFCEEKMREGEGQPELA